MNKPKPHVCAALAHLRPGVTASAILVGCCAVLQLLVFGFVHFTELRFARDGAPSAVMPLSVVPTVPVEARRAPQAPPDRPETIAAPLRPAETRERSVFDMVLRRVSDLAVTLGTATTVVLSVLVLMGVVIGAGSQVPGIERAVSAAMWSMVLALACMPWRDIFSSVPFPGVFTSYAAMTAASAEVAAGRGSFGVMLGTYALIPLAMFVVAMMVLTRFRLAVAAGIIVKSVSELDAAIDREIADIRRKGLSVTGPRAVGALNEAIGEVGLRGMPPAGTAEPARAPEPVRAAQDVGGRAVYDEDYKRPI